MNRKGIISWLFVILLFIGVYYLNPDIFKGILRLKDIGIKNFILISILCIINQFLLGLEIKILCQAFNVHVGVIESFGLSSIRSIANYLPMGAGVISNAIYLKTQKRMSLAHYTSSLTVSIVLMFLTAGVIGFLTSVYFKLTWNSVDYELILLFFSILVGSLIIMALKIPILGSKNFIARFAREFQNGYVLLRRDRSIIQQLIILKSLVLLLLVVKMRILFISVGYEINWGSIILIVMSIVAFRIATIVPGNIGLTETISGFIASGSGSTFEYGFVGMAVDRIIQAIWIFLFGVIFLFYFNAKLKH